MTRFHIRPLATPRRAGVGIAAPIGLALLALAAPSTQAAGLTVKLPTSVQIDWQLHPGQNDPERCIAWAFARFPHIRLAKGYEVAVDDTSRFDRDVIYSGSPPFPDDTLSDFPALFEVPPRFHQIGLSGYSTGSGCTDAILALEGRWKIIRANVSMKGAFSDKYKRPFDECLRRSPRPRVVDRPNVLGRSLEPLMVERAGSSGKVFVTREDAILNWEQQLKREWTGASLGPVLVRTNGDALARITDGAGNGILVGPNMTIRVEAGKPFEVVHQGSKMFGSLGVKSITSHVGPGCVIATQ